MQSRMGLIKWILISATVLKLSGLTYAATRTIYGTMTLIDLTYSAELAVKTSSTYTSLVADLNPKINTLFTTTNTGVQETNNYVFKAGSVKVNFDIVLLTSVVVVTADLQSSVKAKLATQNNLIGTHEVDPASFSLSDSAITTTTTAPATTTTTTNNVNIPSTDYSLSIRIISLDYQDAYGIKTSASHINLANSVGTALKKTCTEIYNTDCTAVAVTNFREGSVWADYTMSLASSLGLSKATVEKAMQDKLSDGNLQNIYKVDFGGDDGGLSPGEIAGIVIGAVLALVLVIVIIACLCVRHFRQQKRREERYKQHKAFARPNPKDFIRDEQKRRLTREVRDDYSLADSYYDRRQFQSLDLATVPRQTIVPYSPYQTSPFVMYGGGSRYQSGTISGFPMLTYPQTNYSPGFSSLPSYSPQPSRFRALDDRRHRSSRPLGLRNARRPSSLYDEYSYRY